MTPEQKRKRMEEDAKAQRAYDQLRRGEIAGVLIHRLPNGAIKVKRMPALIED